MRVPQQVGCVWHDCFSVMGLMALGHRLAQLIFTSMWLRCPPATLESKTLVDVQPRRHLRGFTPKLQKAQIILVK